MPESEEKGHGEEEAVSLGDVYEGILQRGKMPGIPGGSAVARRVCLPQMRLPSCLQTVQWPVSMRWVPPPGISDSGNGASQDPYAADAVVSGLLLCQSRQAGRFRRCADVDAWNDL